MTYIYDRLYVAKIARFLITKVTFPRETRAGDVDSRAVDRLRERDEVRRDVSNFCRDYYRPGVAAAQSAHLSGKEMRGDSAV